MKKLIVTSIAIFLLIQVSFSQSTFISSGQFSVINTSLQDGKIKYDSLAGETKFTVALSFTRASDLINKDAKIQAILVFTDNLGTYDASDTINYITSDFNAGSMLGKIKENVQVTLLSNRKNGTLKVKYRYFNTYITTNNYYWSDYYYFTKQFETINATQPPPNPIIEGDNFICNESFYSIHIADDSSYLWSIQSGQNLVSIVGNDSAKNVELKANNNNLNGFAVIQVRAKAKNSTYVTTSSKQVWVGKPSAPTSINGPSTIAGNASYEYSIGGTLSGATLYEWEVAPHGIGSFTSNGNGASITLKTKKTSNNTLDNAVTIKVRAINSCGSTEYFTKTVTLKGGQGGNQ